MRIGSGVQSVSELFGKRQNNSKTSVNGKYKERYNEALGGMERYVVETKTCYVDVFSHWDFTHVAK